MGINKDLKLIAEKLRDIFEKVFKNLKTIEFNDRTLDSEVLNILRNFEYRDEKLKIEFSEPEDIIYRTESGRTPYDILCRGKIKNKNFNTFINNKFGNIYSNTGNDVTTYNNLLRLYLNIPTQRLGSEIVLNKYLQTY